MHYIRSAPLYALLAMGGIAFAQSPLPAAATPCSDVAHRQFDFWIGDWDVFGTDGKLVGRNLVTPILQGCAMHEHWQGKGGNLGESINFFDAARKRWSQSWIDTSGGALRLEGEFTNGSMTLSDRGATAGGAAGVLNEITWTAMADGAVRQHWRISRDGGNTWTTSFDGRYVRAARPQPPRP